MQVLFNHQSADRHAIFGTESAILHIYGNGYLRIVHRSKSHEHRVVVTAVLGRTGLSADDDVATVKMLTRSAQHRRAHALHNIVVGCTQALV